MKNIYLLLILISITIPGLSQQLLWNGEVNPKGFRTNGVQFAHDGKSILAGTDCHPAKIRRFNTEDGTLTWDYTVSDDLMCIMGIGISASNQYVVAIEEFGNLLLFDYTKETPELINTIKLGKGYAFSTAFSPDSRSIAVGASNGKLFIVDASSGTIKNEVDAHGEWVLSIDYSKDGKLIATGANDRMIKIWDDSGKFLHLLKGHTGKITSLQFSDGGNVLYSSSGDGTVKKWDIGKEEITYTLKVSDKVVHDFALSPDESQMVTLSKDRKMLVWDLGTQTANFPFDFGDDEGKAAHCRL